MVSSAGQTENTTTPQTMLQDNFLQDNLPQTMSQDNLLRGRDGMPGRDGRDGRDGSTGALGSTGPSGERGRQGDVGITGEKGRQGDVGITGEKGEEGEEGPQGERGGQGEEGPQGEKGNKGLTGVQGPTGNLGPRGLVGPKGNRGYPGLAGPQGPQGAKGAQTGGAVYVRWGRTSCPIGQGTELVYYGTAGGTRNSHSGGAANIICMPRNPDHLSYRSGQQGYSYVYGIRLNGAGSQPLSRAYNYYLPCAVCYVSRDTILKIPAKVNCPAKWTREYYGYLMTEHYSHSGRLMYECIDKDAERTSGGSYSGYMYHVEPVCNNGVSCPPYDSSKELTCVVCSR